MWTILSILLVTIVKSEGVELKNELSLISKDTYIVFGAGRRSERELPECEKTEACNLVHKRQWLLPITERFCRCPKKTECPLHYEEDQPLNSQHVSNRAQFKFCEDLDESFMPCVKGSPALEIYEKKPVSDAVGSMTRTNLFCKCPWPNTFVLNKTNTFRNSSKTLIYVCDELPQCKTGETCGHIREDTYEVYYTCSCPEKHLCVFKEPFSYSTQAITELYLPHFRGISYEAVCTSN